MPVSSTVHPEATTLDVRPISGYIGAEIIGPDLSQPLSDEVVAEIRATLLRWKVVFFRDQDITQDQHLAFARRFGEPTPAHPTLPAVFHDHPEILLLDNARSELVNRRGIESHWHTDVTFVPNPPMASILRGVVIPPYGGDTQWTNLVEAYEQLSPAIRTLIDGLHAMHSNRMRSMRGDEPTKIHDTFQSKDIRSVHPMVRVHPETGERALFVNPNFTSHVVELSRRESRHLLALLYEQLAHAEFTCRFRWQPGSIAFWDNRATAHMVPTDVPHGMHRSVQRITLAGDVPVGPDGSRSYALSGETFA
jgi:taurine dioxygenase